MAVGTGGGMPRAMEYRLGLEPAGWQKLWHFHPDCRGYPTRAFRCETVRPLDENLCSRCATLARGGE